MLRKFRSLFFLLSITIVVVFWIINLSLTKQTRAQNKQENKLPYISIEDSNRCIKQLSDDIDFILNQSLSSKTKYSVLVYSLDQNKMIYSVNPDLMLTPASITKLITSYTAFSELGPDYKVQTSVYANNSDIKDSIIDGNIYFVGYGDALFSSNDMDSLVKRIKDKGISSINGSIIADGSFFDGKYYRQEYSGDKDIVEDIPPISALSLDNNTATIIVKGSDNYQVLPPSYMLLPISKSGSNTFIKGNQKNNPIKRTNKKKISSLYRKNNNFLKNYKNFAGDAPRSSTKKKRSTIKISTNLNEKGIQLFHISGSLTKGKEFVYFYPFLKPELAVAGALKYKLMKTGIQVKGEISEPKSNLISEYKNFSQLAIFERPLTQIIYMLVKNSNNYLAESVFKLLGAKLQFTEDNARSARLAINRAFTKIGIIANPCILNDGSGLSRRNLVSASTVMKLLIDASRSSFREQFDSSLSVAGFDGTLKSRMKGTLAEFNLHGKTGTLRDVSGLAGYVYTLDCERFAFVMLFNGPYVSNYKEIENKIGQLLAQFFYYNSEK